MVYYIIIKGLEGGIFMQKQYKLYILDLNNIEKTFGKLYQNFTSDEIIKLSENNIAVKYDYLKKDYKYVLEKMSEIPSTQNIITASKFYSLLKYCIREEIFIESIKLADTFKEDNNRIEKCILKINYNKQNKQEYTNILLSELKWYNYDEGIDIKSMAFSIKLESKPINIKFYIYNNGVILIDDEEISHKVFNIIKVLT